MLFNYCILLNEENLSASLFLPHFHHQKLHLTLIPHRSLFPQVLINSLLYHVHFIEFNPLNFLDNYHLLLFPPNYFILPHFVKFNYN